MELLPDTVIKNILSELNTDDLNIDLTHLYSSPDSFSNQRSSSSTHPLTDLTACSRPSTIEEIERQKRIELLEIEREKANKLKEIERQKAFELQELERLESMTTNEDELPTVLDAEFKPKSNVSPDKAEDVFMLPTFLQPEESSCKEKLFDFMLTGPSTDKEIHTILTCKNLLLEIIKSSCRKCLTVTDICYWIENNFASFRLTKSAWVKNIWRILVNGPYFVEIRTTHMQKKYYWTVDLLDWEKNLRTAKFCAEIHSHPYKTSEEVEQTLTYSSLLQMAIINSTRKSLKANEICDWIRKYYPHFRHAKFNMRRMVVYRLKHSRLFLSEPTYEDPYWTLNIPEWEKYAIGRERKQIKKTLSDEYEKIK